MYVQYVIMFIVRERPVVIMKKNTFHIPGILDSLRADVESGKITLREAAMELHMAGWVNFVDEEKAKRLLRV